MAPCLHLGVFENPGQIAMPFAVEFFQPAFGRGFGEADGFFEGGEVDGFILALGVATVAADETSFGDADGLRGDVIEVGAVMR